MGQNIPTHSSEQLHSEKHQIIINQAPIAKSNGLGTAGFILSLLALILSWMPVANWVLWFLGFIFSLIGVFKSPRGLAIAGLCLSLLSIIVIIALLGTLAAILS